MIAALYVETDGAYFGLPGVDPWDEKRDARRYDGPWPVVAHPPCARWCQLAGLVEHRYGKKKGDDGGCFAAALASVRKFGGVLEHPAESRAWAHFGINRPPRWGGWHVADFQGGWTCHVEQGHFGHRAPKPTWLLWYPGNVAIIPFPALPWGPSGATMGLNTWYTLERADPSKQRREVSKQERSATPPAFRDLLISMARSVRAQKAA